LLNLQNISYFIRHVRLANYFQKKEGHLYLKLFYLYVYSVSAAVGNEIQFWVKINLPETKQSCQGR
jgi:hypothetical protein